MTVELNQLLSETVPTKTVIIGFTFGLLDWIASDYSSALNKLV